jgi:aspartate aminotransferase
MVDEPYRAIVYNGIKVPEIFNHYENTMIITSHSKDLGLAGERIGHIALKPGIAEYDELRRTIAFTTRALGFKSAPSTMQRVVSTLQEATVDVAAYERKRNMLCDGLEKFGFEVRRPQGAFYLFPKTPIEDDVKFVRELQKERILTVPGSGFGRPGHIRISYCVEDETIKRSLPGFEKVARRVGLLG